MKDVTFYWLPNCSTCQKALRWLERRGVAVTAFRDIKEEPLSPLEVVRMAERLGGPSELFSKRAIKYREMKLNERTLKDDEMLDLMSSEYTFLKRPIMQIGEKAIAGFFEMSFERFLADNYFEKRKAESK
jgi:arsenate reductase